MKLTRYILLLSTVALFCATASAQRGSYGVRVKRLSEPQANLYPAGYGVGSPRANSMAAGNRPVIVLTGYWPPTNSMLREFSTSTTQNPGPWIGSDWEGRGYDIYSFFAAPAAALFGVNGLPAFNMLLLMGMVWMGTAYLSRYNSHHVAALFSAGFFVLSPAFAYVFW